MRQNFPMCGRYSLTTPAAALRALFALDAAPPAAPRYNIAPTQAVLAIRRDGAANRAFFARWGLVPGWAKDVATGARLINARAETLLDKAAFRDAAKRRRCLIPADGFYEWRAEASGPKTPFRLCFADAGPMAFAGLWAHWQGPDGSELESCAIVTVDAAPSVAPIHARMPAILDETAFDAWLGGEGRTGLDRLVPYRGSRRLEARAISTRVNSLRNDDVDLWRPADARAGADAPKGQLSLL